MLTPIEHSFFVAYRAITEPFRALSSFLSGFGHNALTAMKEAARKQFYSWFEYALVDGEIVLRRATGKTGVYKSIQGRSVKIGEALRKPTMDHLWENANEVVALKDAAKQEANKRRIDNNLMAEMDHKIISVGG
jgi:hypothetical protein